MPYCPKCGTQVEEHYEVCPECGAKLRGGTGHRSATDSISLAFNLAMSKPMVFLPVIVGGLISTIIDYFTGATTPGWGSSVFLGVGLLLGLVSPFISMLFNFAAIDMARDAYTDRPLNMGDSINYTLGRFLTFIGASIVSVLLIITVILIPVSFLLSVIVVMDETGVMDALSKSFRVLSRRLGDVLVIFIIAVIGSFIIGWIPFVGSLLSACFGVILNFAFIDVYSQFKNEEF